MSEHDEIIFNLFLIEFMMDYWPTINPTNITESMYLWTIEYSDHFKMLEDCFPLYEVAEERNEYQYPSNTIKDPISYYGWNKWCEIKHRVGEFTNENV